MTGNNSILSRYPPSTMIQGEAMQFITDYLKRYGPIRGPFELKRDGENRPLPSASVPGYIHMSLQSMASHRALPYSGSVPALIRDLVYFGLGAYAHVLSEYGDDPDQQLPAHIINREETFRRELYVDLTLLNYQTDLIAAARILELHTRAGDKRAVFDQLSRVCDHISRASEWKEHLVRTMSGIPEFFDALDLLNASPSNIYYPEAEAWTTVLVDAVLDRDD